MTWRPQYRNSKFRHVFGKAATKENCYDGVAITCSVHDNHLCAVNPRFLAVITECAGGGAFLETSTKVHRANKVLFLGNLKMLMSTGNSHWNQRQIALWDQ
ncbi:coronin-2A, partial [Clarias magur]